MKQKMMKKIDKTTTERENQQPRRDQRREHHRRSEDERQNSWRHGVTSSDANTRVTYLSKKSDRFLSETF